MGAMTPQTINLDHVQEEVKRLRVESRKPLLDNARNDIDSFIEYVMEDENGYPIRQAPIHNLIQGFINQAWDHDAKALILAPLEHGKSYQTVGRLGWEVGRNPNIRIKLVCSSDDSAIKRVMAISDLIQSPRFLEVFPEISIADARQWTMKKITVNRTGSAIDPTLEACGVFGSLMGSRADIIVFDDIVDYKNAIQDPALRPKVKGSFSGSWLTRLTKGAKVLYIATPYHKDDLTAELKKSSDYALLDVVVSKDASTLVASIGNGQLIEEERSTFKVPLWDRWDRTALLEKKKTLGPIVYARSYEGKVMSDEDKTFPDFGLCKTDDRIEDIIDGSTQYFVGVDLSGKKRKGNVIWVGGITNGMKHPVDIRRGNWSSTEVADQMELVENKYSPLIYLVEDNGYQVALIDWIRKAKSNYSFSHKIASFTTTGANKMNETLGLPALNIEFSNREWIIPTGGLDEHELGCDCGLHTWISSMEDYPFSSETDTVMASWFYTKAVEKAQYAKRSLASIRSGVKRDFLDPDEVL